MEQVYGDPETLFKKMFSDPKLQLEIMARHLNHLVQNLRRAEVKDPFTRAIAKYDADQADTYIPNVKKCVACLKGNPNNLDCLKGLHEKSKLKKVVKRKRKK
jgi:hypothetical protein